MAKKLTVGNEIVEELEAQRRDLYKAYLWQVLWGLIFLILVFVSSFYIGLRTGQLWLYVIMPLIVIGGFWIYVKTTYQQVQQKFDSKLISRIVEDLSDEFSVFEQYNFDEHILERAKFFPEFSKVEVSDAIVGEVLGRHFVIVDMRVIEEYASNVFYNFLLFVSIDLDREFPQVIILPDKIRNKIFLEEQGKVLKEYDGYLILMDKGGVAEDVAEVMMEQIQKWSKEQGKEYELYFSLGGKQMYLGVGGERSFISLPLSKRISAQVLENLVERLRRFLDMMESFVRELDRV